MTIDLSSLEKAVGALDRALAALEKSPLEGFDEHIQETLKAGVIQNFEVAYEQSWKFIQRWMRENAVPEEAEHPRTRKDLFRAAARLGLVPDPEPWFVFGDARNMTSHAYDETQADYVYAIAQQFLPQARELLDRLTKAND